MRSSPVSPQPTGKPAPLALLGGHGDATPIAWREGQLLTAEALRTAAARVAANLPFSEGADEVLIVCGDQWTFTVGLLAAWHCGYVVALPPNTQPQTLLDLRARPTISRVLHDGGLGSDWSGAIDVRTEEATGLALPSLIELEPERPVATLYTSGTTGESVPCRKVARQLLGEAKFQAAFLQVGPAARMLVTAPPQHIYGLLMGILTPLMAGAAMVCGRALLPEALSALARASGATHLASVPAHLRALSMSREGSFDLGAVHTFVSSSAPLEAELSTRLVAGGARLVELLGSTETGGIASRSPPANRWTPLEGVTVEADDQGHLRVDSPFLERPGTALTTADDIALESDGTFTHLGRADGVVKIGGRRVGLQDLERELRGLPGVLDAAVAAFPSTAGRGSELWAMVAGTDLSVEVIRRGLLAHFDPTVLPRRFRLLAALPREASGKVTKAAWLAAFADPEDALEVDVQDRQLSEEAAVSRVDVRLRVPPNLFYLRGHFDGFPILSGIFILNKLVVGESQRAWPDLGAAQGLSQVKFRKPIFPEAQVAITLRRRQQLREVTFSMTTNGRECTSGTVLFGGAT